MRLTTQKTNDFSLSGMDAGELPDMHPGLQDTRAIEELMMRAFFVSLEIRQLGDISPVKSSLNHRAVADVLLHWAGAMEAAYGTAGTA